MNWARSLKKKMRTVDWDIDNAPIMKALDKGETYNYPPTLIHGAMWYKCGKCGKRWRMWLEKGLEDRMMDELEPDKHKPVPFTIGCKCGGLADHVDWYDDIHFGYYKPISDNMSYFKNDANSDCGIPVLR